MALIKLGAFVSKISGKIGGQSFGTSRGGSYIKNVSSQIKPRTPAQAKIKAQTAHIAQNWRLLTESQRNKWNMSSQKFPYVNRVGQTAYYSGYSLYQKQNQGLLSIGLPLQGDAQSPVEILIPVVNVTQIPGSSAIITATNIDSELSYHVWATPSLSEGIQNPYNYFKRVGVVQADDLEFGFGFNALYATVFGMPVAGTTVFFSVIPVSQINGMTGPFNTFNRIVIN